MVSIDDVNDFILKIDLSNLIQISFPDVEKELKYLMDFVKKSNLFEGIDKKKSRMGLIFDEDFDFEMSSSVSISSFLKYISLQQPIIYFRRDKSIFTITISANSINLIMHKRSKKDFEKKIRNESIQLSKDIETILIYLYGRKNVEEKGLLPIVPIDMMIIFDSESMELLEKIQEKMIFDFHDKELLKPKIESIILTFTKSKNEDLGKKYSMKLSIEATKSEFLGFDEKRSRKLLKVEKISEIPILPFNMESLLKNLINEIKSLLKQISGEV